MADTSARFKGFGTMASGPFKRLRRLLIRLGAVKPTMYEIYFED